VIGKDTASAIQAGIIFGYAGLVDGMVRRMQAEMGGPAKVIATGGLAPLMQHVAETIQEVDTTLTLEGLRIISASLNETA
jgi:type III pantothenate kinase